MDVGRNADYRVLGVNLLAVVNALGHFAPPWWRPGDKRRTRALSREQSSPQCVDSHFCGENWVGCRGCTQSFVLILMKTPSHSWSDN